MHTSSESTCASAASSRKAEANRANAQKSTGPRSEAGKSRSSRNATRHGLLSQVSTLLEKPNQELETLCDKYRSEFLPSSTHEEMLVRELAVSDWRLKQNTRIETGLLSVEMHAVYSSIVNMEKAPLWHEAPPMACQKCGDVHRDEAPGETEPEPPELSDVSDHIRTALMGAAWANDPAAFALLVRYQSQARRDYFRALKQLELVRTGKAGYLPEKPPSRMGKPIEPEPACGEPNEPICAALQNRCRFVRRQSLKLKRQLGSAGSKRPRGRRPNEPKCRRIQPEIGQPERPVHRFLRRMASNFRRAR